MALPLLNLQGVAGDSAAREPMAGISSARIASGLLWVV